MSATIVNPPHPVCPVHPGRWTPCEVCTPGVRKGKAEIDTGREAALQSLARVRLLLEGGE